MCVHVSLYIYIYNVYMYICVYIYTCIQVYVCVYICLDVHVCVYRCIYVCICPYMCIYLGVCVQIFHYIYSNMFLEIIIDMVCVYIYTYIYSNSHRLDFPVYPAISHPYRDSQLYPTYVQLFQRCPNLSKHMSI